MLTGSAAVSRAVYIGMAGVWGVVAIAVGLRAMLDWPFTRTGVSGRVGLLCGLGFIAVGMFMSSVVADQLFPRAHRRFTAVVELVPWIAFTLTLIGGLLWAL